MVEPLFIVGATAVGKSAVALQLALETGAAILVMDSMQVYRGLEIGVSKPSPGERALVTHGGLDLVDWRERFDVSRYIAAVAPFIEECRQAAKPLIICGGTGLYYRALTQGLCAAPAAPAELREELGSLSLEELQARLQKVDPVMWSRVDQQNKRRLQRAIEVMESSGRSLAEWQRVNSAPLLPTHRTVWLQCDRPLLQERVEARLQAMVTAGWPEEVRALVQAWGGPAVAEAPAIGYRAWGQVCAQELFFNEARAQIVRETMDYAKRQVTWFRRETGWHPLYVGPVTQTSALVAQTRAHWSSSS
jgi:tRNA dimethylallyltransferase